MADLITQSQFPGEVSINIATLTHDFAKYVGVERYQYISTSMQALYAGLGDRLFRLEAFPQLPDNTQQYLQRYFWGKGEDEQRVKDLIAKKRSSLGAYLDELITRYELDKARLGACFKSGIKLVVRASPGSLQCE